MRTPNSNQFYEQTRTAKRVLAVDLGFLGDALQLAPALWEIRRHYPAAALHVLSSSLGAEALRLLPCLDRVWSVRLKAKERSLREHLSVLRALRRTRFDVAFNFNTNDRSVILTGLLGARQSVAPAGKRTQFWKRWLVRTWVSYEHHPLPVFEHKRRFLAACGFHLEPPRFGLRVSEEYVRWATPLVPGGSIHLSLSSANPYKEWPLEHHVRLLRLLWARRPELHVLASAAPRAREAQRVESLAAQVNDPRFRPLPQPLSIGQLAAVLTRCRLQLGPDSGVMHLAAALEVPTVSLFRDYGTFNAWMPSGAIHRVLSAPCCCVDHHDAPCEKLKAPACLARIEPETVAAAVLEQLVRTAATPPRGPQATSAPGSASAP